MWCTRPRGKMGRKMTTKAKQPGKVLDASKCVRMSVSLPRDLHDILARLADRKRVSVAWVIRDAAEKYVGDQWPLFKRDLT